MHQSSLMYSINIIRMLINCRYGRTHMRTSTINSNGKFYRTNISTTTTEKCYFQLKWPQSLASQRHTQIILRKIHRQHIISIVIHLLTMRQCRLKWISFRHHSATQRLRRTATFKMQKSSPHQTIDCHHGWKYITYQTMHMTALKHQLNIMQRQWRNSRINNW